MTPPLDTLNAKVVRLCERRRTSILKSAAIFQVAREQAGYTQDTLSEMLGMTPNHLSAIERGASGISLEALQRLCRLLGVSADRIIFGTDDPEVEALALARRISDIKPEYRQQVQELLSAILNMS